MFVNLDYMYIFMIVTRCTRVYPNMGMSGNNYHVCVCAAELLVWFRLFELAVVRGCGRHETIIASWFSEMCDQFLTSCSYMYASVGVLRLDTLCAVQNAGNYGVVLSESACSVHTGCVFLGTLVFVRFHDYTVAKLKTLVA